MPELDLNETVVRLCMSEFSLVLLSWHTFGTQKPDIFCAARAEFSKHAIVRMFEPSAALSFVALFQDFTAAARRGA